MNTKQTLRYRGFVIRCEQLGPDCWGYSCGFVTTNNLRTMVWHLNCRNNCKDTI